jgi:hypothetical protein
MIGRGGTAGSCGCTIGAVDPPAGCGLTGTMIPRGVDCGGPAKGKPVVGVETPELSSGAGVATWPGKLAGGHGTTVRGWPCSTQTGLGDEPGPGVAVPPP